MVAMSLIHLCFGGDSPLGYVKNKVLLKKISATTGLSSKTIPLNRTTIWKDFSQYISKYMALKVRSLKFFEQCMLSPNNLDICVFENSSRDLAVFCIKNMTKGPCGELAKITLVPGIENSTEPH